MGGSVSKKLLTEFAVKDLLGTGAFGAVIRAQNKFDENSYAVKLVILDKNNTELSLREVKSFSKLRSHENVVPYKTSWIDEISGAEMEALKKHLKIDLSDSDILRFNTGTYWSSPVKILCIQMELCEQSLRSWNLQNVTEVGRIDELLEPYCQRLDKVNEDLNISLMIQILSGLKHIHEQDILHRDLKPDNIFLSTRPNGKLIAKIGGLGLAKHLTPGIGPAYHSKTGTAIYVAPEQELGKYDKRADIYPLGIILLELFHPTSLDLDFIKTIAELRVNQTIPDVVKIRWPTIEKLILEIANPRYDQRPTIDGIYDSLRSSYDLFQTGFAHWSVSCDGCQAKPIRGKRYNCQDCTREEGFDFCSDCMKNKADTHDPDHKFKAMDHKDTRNHFVMCIKKIDEYVEEHSANGNAPRICSRCKDPLLNIENNLLFKCNDCDDCFYCKSCMAASKMHKHLHKFQIFQIMDGREVMVENPNSEDDTEDDLMIRLLLALALKDGTKSNA